MSKILKRVIAIALIAMFSAMTCLTISPRLAEDEEILFRENALKPLPMVDQDAKSGADDDEIVTIMVKLEDKPLLAVTQLSDTKSGKISERLEAGCEEMITVISKAIGEEIDPLYTYKLLFNGFSFKGKAGLIDKIRKVKGVADCYRSMSWSAPEVKEEAPTKVNGSDTVVNADDLWAAGFTGEGMVIAVIDTGIKVDHSNFATAPDGSRLNAESIQSALDQFNMNCEDIYTGTLTGDYTYYSEKIPFRFNYAYGSVDVSHASAGNGHGTHVSSIAAGNDSSVKGIAYNAQIIPMQVFQGGGADWAVILAAMEDCAYLGVDCINMSLGSDSGFTTGDADTEAVLELLYNSGVNIAAAAGNSAIVGYGNAFGFNAALADDPDNGIVASPSTYSGSMSVSACSNSVSGAPADFSSWGSTSDLKIKPEIMAPGVSIYAATDPTYASGQSYSYMSGTSMASPDVAGCIALLLQYIKSEYPELTGAERLDFANTLLLSTARPRSSGGVTYSPRAQGAGLIDLEAAMNTTVYLEVQGSDRPKLELGDDPERTGVFELVFDLVNFGTEDQSYDINTNVQTETAGSETLNGITVNVMACDVMDITENSIVTGDSAVTVPANGRATVSITIDMSAYGTQLDNMFSNGIYVEGFVQLINVSGGENLSIPYLGFYGAWDEAPIIDRTYYWDIAVGEESWNTHDIPNTAGSSFSSSYFELGVNPYMDVAEFYADHISISPNGDNRYDTVDVIYTGLLRNCRYVTYTVTNAETGEVILTDVHEGMPRGWYTKDGFFGGYYYPLGAIEGYGEFVGWSGEGLSEGETAIISIDAVLDYDGFDPEINDGASWSFPVTIDTAAPEVVYWRVGDGRLALYATDAHYLAHVAVYSSSRYNTDSLIDQVAINERTRGKISMLSFDIGDLDTVYVKLGDYANNIAKVELTGEGGALEAVPLAGIELDKDAIETYVGATSEIELITIPEDANNYDVEWVSADENIATVSGGFKDAEVIGISEGVTVITVTATDRDTGDSFTMETEAVVNSYPTVDEAFNAEGYSYSFATSGNYPWEVDDTESSGDRFSIKSTNAAVASSSSMVALDAVTLEAGNVVYFDWMVSSEENYDRITFYVNNRLAATISGTVNWETYSYMIEEDGEYSFKWIYFKNSGQNAGEDCGRLDNFRIIASAAVLGDVNGDEMVNTADALLVLRYGLGVETFTDDQLAVSDMDGNGAVDTADALIILRISIGAN